MKRMFLTLALMAVFLGFTGLVFATSPPNVPAATNEMTISTMQTSLTSGTITATTEAQATKTTASADLEALMANAGSKQSTPVPSTTIETKHTALAAATLLQSANHKTASHAGDTMIQAAIWTHSHRSDAAVYADTKTLAGVYTYDAAFNGRSELTILRSLHRTAAHTVTRDTLATNRKVG